MFGKKSHSAAKLTLQRLFLIFLYAKKTQSAMNKKVVDLAKKRAMLAERNASYMLFENLAVL